MNRFARQHRSRTARWWRSGLGLVELLISLVICALLLTAIAAAFSASTSAVELNDRFFRAAQSGRVAMTQILTAVRRSDSCQVGDVAPSDSVTTVSSSTLRVISSEPALQETIYRLAPSVDGASSVLQLIPDATRNSTAHTLANNVGSATFSGVMAGPPGARYVARVTVDLRIKVDDNELVLSASTTPRRTLTP